MIRCYSTCKLVQTQTHTQLHLTSPFGYQLETAIINPLWCASLNLTLFCITYLSTQREIANLNADLVLIVHSWLHCTIMMVNDNLTHTTQKDKISFGWYEWLATFHNKSSILNVIAFHCFEYILLVLFLSYFRWCCPMFVFLLHPYLDYCDC